MWEFFIRHNKFSYLLIVALVAVGAYSVIAIPKESAPEVVIPVGVVVTTLPGAPAADVESLVTNEIERGLVSLENVKKVTSNSRESVSSVTVEFEADADIDASIQDLKDEVDKIKADLPTDAEDPQVMEVNFVDQPILTISIAGDLLDEEFTALSKQLEDEIESVSGVSRVELRGVRDREVAVIVDQTALARFELSLSDVTTAIRNANLTFPVGQIVNDGVSYNVAFEGDITDTDQIKNIGIATRGGQPVYVKDIAIVEDGLAPASSLSRLSVGGQPSQNAITVDVYKQSGGDITRITAAVNERVNELKADGKLLDGLTSVTVLDSGDQIKKDLVNLTSSGLQTIFLVMLLIVLAIGWREGIVAGLAIPLSFLFGFIGLYFSGNTINFLSLFALILGIGILVDSAIVMVEGINRKMKEDPTIDKKQAAILSIHEFSAPLISGTLTTVSMFVGLFIVSGIIGQFIASIPFTLIFILFASMFVALAIVPLIASGFLRRRSATVFEQKQLEYAHRLESWYKSKLVEYIESEEKQRKFFTLLSVGLVASILLAVNLFAAIIVAPLLYILSFKLYHLQDKKGFSDFKRKLMWFPLMLIVTVGVVMGASKILPVFNPVKVIFFEQSDSEWLIVEVELPEGTTKEVTDVAVRRVEEVLYDESEIESFAVTVGSGSQFGSGGTGEKFANIFITLNEDRDRVSTEIITDLREQMKDFNDFKVTVDQPSDGPPTGAAIVVKFLGDDLVEITRLANETANVFKENPQVVNVETSTNNNSTEFVLNLDREKTAALGLNPLVVSQIARTAVYGSDATSLTTPTEDIDVVVKLNINNDDAVRNDTANNTNISSLEQIMLPTQSGPVALSTLVTTSLRESSSVINHEEGKRVVSITADVVPGATPLEVQTEVLKQVEEKLDIPSDVTISTGGGETEDTNKAFGEMFAALIVGVLLMVAVLVLQFNSYLHTRYVLSILPYSLIGIMVGLGLTQSSLSFPSLMGFIALSGIVVNNSILLIEMMNQIRKTSPEMPLRDVVLEASASRLRPILLTSTTTVVGMIPLTFAGDMWAPLAYAVMFGLVFSVLITLVLIPLTYYHRPGDVE